VVAVSRGAGGGSYSIQGIDAASYQGSINWTSVHNAGLTFGFEKATEGTSYVNPYFARNWANMKANGIIRGAYHFGHPSLSATTQADFFINTVKPVSGDLQMALDIEVTDGRTPSQVWTWIQAFIARIQSRTGRGSSTPASTSGATRSATRGTTSTVRCGWRPTSPIRPPMCRPPGAPGASGSTPARDRYPGSAATSIATPGTALWIC
jgi:hypothetical protein